jgi:transcriptional regulator with XRE-family HTH domain
MKINADLILALRKKRAWSQEELATAAGLNVRTVQRIEKEASASLHSKKALASAFDIAIQDLDHEETQMKPCPECNSDKIYRYKEEIDAEGGHGPDLLPKLASGILKSAKFLPVVCAECGYVRFFASEEAMGRLESSKHWIPI